jgi:hypothetical protein
MGWFSGIVKAVKKAFKSVTKVVKKVVKGIGKVAKKVWKGVKNVAKGIGKVVKKMGPLASIAIGFIPGFQALWANAGIWGAMGKGALTGFITSGGKLKGALTGGLLGGAGYAIGQGASAMKQGWKSAGESASISDKISSGFGAVADSTTQGVSNMFESANNLASGGQGGLNYLKADPITGEMTSIYGKSEASVFARMDGESVLHRANKGYLETLEPDAKEWISKNPELFKEYTPNQMNQIFEQQKSSAGMAYGLGQSNSVTIGDTTINANINDVIKGATPAEAHRVGKLYAQVGTDGKASQLDKLVGQQYDVANEKTLAELGGYEYDKYVDTYLTPSSAEYQSALDARGLDAQSWVGKTLGQPLKPNMMDANYEGHLKYTETSTDPDDTNFYKSKRTVAPRTNAPTADKLKDAASSLFGSSGSSSPYGAGFSTGDTGDQYDAGGGSLLMSGQSGTGLDFAASYGGAQGGSAYAQAQANKMKQIYG